ncbi:hypothetical protein BOMU111920_03785 [Bordetella muralis]
MRAGSDALTLKVTVEHGPPGHDDGGQVGGRRSHEQGRRSFVAADQQYGTIDGLTAHCLLDRQCGQIAIQHRGRPVGVLGNREHWYLDGKAASLPDAGLHLLGQFAQVPIAWRQVRPGIQDADDRTAVEQVVWMALILEPAAVIDDIARIASIPML